MRGFIALCEHDALAAVNVPNLLCYEDLQGAEATEYAWPVLDENTASALCYTPGTTGDPNGALQSHRQAAEDAVCVSITATGWNAPTVRR